MGSKRNFILRVTTVLFKALSDEERIRYPCLTLLKFIIFNCNFLQKGLTHFLSQINKDIFHICDGFEVNLESKNTIPLRFKWDTTNRSQRLGASLQNLYTCKLY